MKEHAGGVPQPGDIIAGKYRVEQVLGAGGMGVVVAARHVALKQAVAVKFLLPQALKLQGASERFLREAQASVAITSEHVARVLDVGTLEGGAPYIVMECLSGTDLARLLKQRRMLAVHEAVDFVLQAGEAIAEAHTLGIVHRDLKPSNIFLTRRAEGSALVKVLDFGLSKMTAAHGDGDHSLTATDVVAGSPDYMSPEQVRSLKNVDGRTDLWALGVVLYELLTGKRPFHGPTPAAICASVAADRPLPLRALRADVPEGLDAAVLRCLEKDPRSRPQSVGELATSLAPFAPPESKASIERIVRLSPRAVGAWGDGMESVTMPLGARGAVTPAPAVPRNTPFAAAAPGPGVHAASAPTFAARAATGAESRSGERAAPTPTLNDVGAHPSGPTGGWGQTRPPGLEGVDSGHRRGGRSGVRGGGGGGLAGVRRGRRVRRRGLVGERSGAERGSGREPHACCGDARQRGSRSERASSTERLGIGPTGAAGPRERRSILERRRRRVLAGPHGYGLREHLGFIKRPADEHGNKTRHQEAAAPQAVPHDNPGQATLTLGETANTPSRRQNEPTNPTPATIPPA